MLELVQSNGIQGLTFGKIATQAGVSSGTPYIYFHDKEDMLSKIYVQVKEIMDAGLDEEISQGTTLQDQLFLGALHFARNMLAHPLETVYLRAIRANPQAVTPEAIKQGSARSSTMRNLYQKAIEADILVTNREDYINALLFAPFMDFMATRHAARQPVTLSELTTMINMSLAALIKHTD
ncbi:TetR family transcriptional regulator [Secundilactobacillus folii]|uniref:TetR family transcriptional regulator n=1 Tax=Secundilactobacillus folii TaxID=2678357 RepID=UPI001566E54B